MEAFLWGWVAGVASLLWRERLDDGWLGSGLLVVAGSLLVSRALSVAVPARLLVSAAAGLLLGVQLSAQVAQAQLDAWLPADCEGRTLSARGTVVGLPEPTAAGGLAFRFRPDAGECVVAPALWQLSLRDPVAPRPGERWRLSARLKRPQGNQNPGGFDGERWWHQERVTATGWATGARRLAVAPASLDGLRWRIRQMLLSRFPQQPSAGTVLALLTGDRVGIPPESWARYARTGVTHLVAISGVHITMIAWLTGWLARRCWLRWPAAATRVPAARIAGVAGWLAACGYGALAGMGLPTQRTLLMLGLLVLARWLPGEYPGRLILLMALSVVLAVDPLAVHSVGLWLSFAAVALLMAGGMAPGEEGGWRAALRAQWLATWGLLPLTLALFARVSWISLPVNLLAIPWVTFAIVPLAMLGLILQPLHAGLGELAWQGAVLLMTWLDDLLSRASSWPGAASELALPGVSVIWLALACGLMLMPRALPGRALILLPLLAVIWPQPALSPGQMRLTVLDVGQGLSVHIRTAGHDLLFDTGPPMGSRADAGDRVILPYLRWWGVRALDLLLLSHDDLDHTGGAGSLLRGLPVRRLLGVWPSTLADWAPVRRPAMAPCRAGQSWTWDGVRFDILWPGPALLDGDNNRSCVLRVEAMGQVALIPGDLEAPGERALLAGDAGRLRADLLVLGHHGSRTSSTAAFLRAVRPREVIAAVGYRNRYRHPAPVVVRRLAAMAIPGWRTDATGALRYDFLRPGEFPQVRRWRQERARYWLLPVTPAGQPGGRDLSMLGALPAFP